MDDRQTKTHKDNQNTSYMIGNIYYKRCEDRPEYFRTIRISQNFLTGHLQTQVSNITPGDPPPDMEELPPGLHHRVNSMNNKLPYTR